MRGVQSLRWSLCLNFTNHYSRKILKIGHCLTEIGGWQTCLTDGARRIEWEIKRNNKRVVYTSAS